MVTQSDIYHYNDAKLLKKYAEGEVSMLTTKTGGTGDSIIKLNLDVNPKIIEWFKKYL